MSEMSEAVLDGEACAWCGVFFEEPHGYPVLCDGCASDTTEVKMISQGLQHASSKEL